MTRIRVWGALAASLAVTAAVFGYLFSEVPPRRFVETIRTLAPRPLVAFACLFALGVLARALRFWVLLGRTVPLQLVVIITLARNLFIDLLPSRLGEVSYVYLIAKRAQRPVEDGVATVVLAAALDVIVLVPLLLMALVAVGSRYAVPTAWLVIAGLCLAGVGLWALRASGPIARTAAERLSRHGGRLAGRAAARLELLSTSLERARTGLWTALALTVLVRVCKYGAIYCSLLAIMLPLGYLAEQLAFFPLFLAAVSAELSTTLPVHGLAGFGTYEAAWVFSMVQLGYPREHAILSGVVGHAISQVLEYSAGLAALLWLMWSRRSDGAVARAAGPDALRRL